jgi:hypothetical protein
VCISGLALALVVAEGVQQAYPWDLYAEGGNLDLAMRQFLASLAIVAAAAVGASMLTRRSNQTRRPAGEPNA